MIGERSHLISYSCGFAEIRIGLGIREETDSFVRHEQRCGWNGHRKLRVSVLDISHLDAVAITCNEHLTGKLAGRKLSEKTRDQPCAHPGKIPNSTREPQ